MRRALALGAALALAACAHRGAVPAEAPQGPTAPVAAGTPLAFTTARYPDGTPYALESDRGSVVLLDVWATWCEPCRAGLPLYARLGQELGARGLKVYALSVDEDTRAIGKFLADTGATLPVLHDPDALVAERLLGVQQMPTTFLIDRKGVVRRVHEGLYEDLDAAYAEYRAEVEALLAEPAPDGRADGGQ